MALEFLSGENNKEQNRALDSADRAKKRWADLEGQYNKDDIWDPGANGGQGGWVSNLQSGTLNVDQTPGDPFDDTQGTLRTYGFQDPREGAVREDFLDPNEAAAQGLQGMSAFDPRFADGGSAFADNVSAFNSRDPSAFGDMSSAFGDVSYDQDALSRMRGGGDYFENLSSGGTDPIADAQMARRVAEAEGSRRANTDAALAAEEARGAGSGSGRLLAELSNQQASVGDQYLAGLDANAMAAARRDMAAGRGAEIGQMIGSEQRALDTARAQGLDTNATARAQGLDTYSDQNATGLDRYGVATDSGMDDFAQGRMQGMDDWAQGQYQNYYGVSGNNADRQQGVNTRNTARGQSVADSNVDIWNNAANYNTVDRPQTAFQQNYDMTQGHSNADIGGAGIQQHAGDEKSRKATETFDKWHKEVKDGVKAIVGGAA